MASENIDLHVVGWKRFAKITYLAANAAAKMALLGLLIERRGHIVSYPEIIDCVFETLEPPLYMRTMIAQHALYWRRRGYPIVTHNGRGLQLLPETTKNPRPRGRGFFRGRSRTDKERR